MSTIIAQFQRTRSAAASLAMASGETRNAILRHIALLIQEKSADILQENQKDLDQMSVDHPMRDRLKLTPERLVDLAESVISVTQLPDPAGHVLSQKTLPNGLKLTKITVPLGVVGVIFESRPNVTIDVAALWIRSGECGGFTGWFRCLSDEYHFSRYCSSSLNAARDFNGSGLLNADRP